MATYTNHYEMTKQQSPERVSVGLLNDNFDIIDGVMFANQEKADQMADDYNASETYNTGDYVRRENYLYKCNTDNITGTWDDTKWDRVKVMDEITQGGGGGSSTLAGLNDVNLASPTDGQLLGYNGTSHKWENVNGGGGGSSTFAGLNDVNVAGVANKDIARFNSSTNKWEKSSDLTDLELSVSQLSSSVLSIAGDVDTLELTVSQMSASTLPYDANTSTKQKIDAVEANTKQEYTDLTITNSSGIAETNKATLYASGNIGYVYYAFTCRDTTQETITISLPQGWVTLREGAVIRDNNNGNLVSVFNGAGGNMSTFMHTGTMTVGHLFFGTMKAVKTS